MNVPGEVGGTIRIGGSDDHPMYRSGLRVLLCQLAGMDVVGEASNGRQAIDLVTTEIPDVVIMDLAMPDIDGIEATRRISTTAPKVGVLILTIQKTTTRYSRPCGPEPEGICSKSPTRA